MAIKGDTTKLPLIGLVPVHPPEDIHDVALADDQEIVDEPPAFMLVGLADNVTVGTGGGGVVPGYALFDPGNTGTPPGTFTSTILTLEVTMA